MLQDARLTCDNRRQLETPRLAIDFQSDGTYQIISLRNSTEVLGPQGQAGAVPYLQHLFEVTQSVETCIDFDGTHFMEHFNRHRNLHGGMPSTLLDRSLHRARHFGTAVSSLMGIP